jgi:uncharacterized protein involved in high-affinity Fe2+ transport
MPLSRQEAEMELESTRRAWTPRLALLCMALALAGLVAACGSSVGLTTTSASSSVGAKGSDVAAMKGMSGMAGTAPGAKGGNGIKAVPTQTLGAGDWQGMKIQARAMTAVPFVSFNGTKERMVRPPKNVSFHLMIDLSDARTRVAIPYATVWASIRKNGKLIYDERQWPMISEYMGPHYGNNVALPGPGRYQLSLLVSPPVSARHIEYRKVWLKPHRLTMSFNWQPS